MDPKDKNEIRERAMQNIGRWLTHEERRERKQRSKERRANAPRKRPRRHDWDEDDEAEGVEAMASRDRTGGRSQAPSVDTTATSSGLGREALVLSLSQGRALLAIDGEARDVPLSFELARTQSASVAVGDVVEVVGEGSGARVGHVRERRSRLARPDPGNAYRERVLAANVDLAVVVLSVVAPPLRPALVDRFLVALEYGGVAPVLCVNKVDLLEGSAARDQVERVLAPYRELGVPCTLASAASGEGIEELAEAVRDRTCVFVRHSGVGKSSLLNALDPDRARSTGGVRTADGKGRHTTTSSRLTELGDGTRVIDTPGIRAFGLWNLDGETLRHSFAEFAGPSASCRFRDCTHVHEPECAVRAAVEAGAIARSRFEAYLRLEEELR